MKHQISTCKRRVTNIVEFLKRNIREHSDMHRICHIDSTSDSTGNIYIVNHGNVKIKRIQHGTDGRENSTFGTDKVVNINFCDLHILNRTGFLFKCDHIASHAIVIVTDSLALADEFTLRIDDSCHKEFTDHINDTGTTKSYRLGSRIPYNLVCRLHGLFINGTCLNGTISGTHTAADVSTLKSRTCGTCTAHHEIGITEYQLSVSTKVNKQRELRSVPDHTYQCTCSDISTYIASDIRRHDNMCVRVDLNSHI